MVLVGSNEDFKIKNEMKQRLELSTKVKWRHKSYIIAN